MGRERKIWGTRNTASRLSNSFSEPWEKVVLRVQQKSPIRPNRSEASVPELKIHYFQNISACSPPDFLTDTDISHPLTSFIEKHSAEEEENNFMTLIGSEGSQPRRRLDTTICSAVVTSLIVHVSHKQTQQFADFISGLDPS